MKKHTKMTVLEGFIATLIVLTILCIGQVDAYFQWDNIKQYDSVTSTATIKNSLVGFPLDTVATVQLKTPHIVNTMSGKDRLVAEFEINLESDDYKYEDAFKNFDFYDKNDGYAKFNRPITIRYKVLVGTEPYYRTDCSNVDKYMEDNKDALAKNDSEVQKNIPQCLQVKVGDRNVYKWEDTKAQAMTKGTYDVGIFTDVYEGDNVEWIPTLFGDNTRITEWAGWTTGLNNGLYAYYTMNESGTKYDSIGYHNITFVGGGNWFNTSGKVSGGMLKGEGSNYGNMSRILQGLINGNETTFAFWYWSNHTWASGQQHSIFEETDAATDPPYWNQFFFVGYNCNANGGGTCFWLRQTETHGSGLNTAGYDVGVLSDSTWHYLVYTIKPNNLTIWKDGAVALSTDIGTVGGSSLYNYDVSLGSTSGNQYTLGLGDFIDEMAWWNRSLNNSEVATLYNSGSGITYGPIAPSTPVITISDPQNASYNRQVSLLNFTVTNTPSACWYSTNNGTTNSSVFPCSSNVTITANEGSNTWMVFANDSANVIYNKSVTFFQDTRSPIVTITFPQNTTYGYNVSAINFTLVHNGTTTCWYSTNEGATNTTTSCTANVTGVPSKDQSSNHWIFWSNDSLGNTNRTEVTFYQDTLLNWTIYDIYDSSINTSKWFTYNTASETNSYIQTYAVNIGPLFSSNISTIALPERNTILNMKFRVNLTIQSDTNSIGGPTTCGTTILYLFGNPVYTLQSFQPNVPPGNCVNPTPAIFTVDLVGNGTTDYFNLSFDGVFNQTLLASDDTIKITQLSSASAPVVTELTSNIYRIYYLPNITIPIVPFTENNQTYNANSYEGTNETFNINITYDNVNYTLSSASLNYGGVVYTDPTTIGTGSNIILQKSFIIPIGMTGSNRFNWTMRFTNSTGTYNITSHNHDQVVSPLILAICNSTNNAPYINFTFKNETIAQESVKASISSSSFKYWSDSALFNKTYSFTESGENSSYALCITPSTRSYYIESTMSYSNAESQQRIFNQPATSYPNTSTNYVLFLLPTQLGILSRYKTVTSTDSIVPNVYAQVYLSGTSSKVASGFTDSSGLIAFFLNPSTQYDYTFTKTGYPVTSFTLIPSSTDTYTVTMGQGINSQIIGNGTNIFTNNSITITPSDSSLNNNTDYTFQISMTCGTNPATFISVNITNSSGYQLGYNSFSGCGTASVVVNTGNYSSLNGYFHIETADGESTTIASVWNVGNNYAGSYSLYTQLMLFNGYGFGNFIKILIALLVIIGLTVYLSNKEILDTSESKIIVVVLMVWFFSIVGWLDIGTLAPPSPNAGINALASLSGKYGTAIITTAVGVFFIFRRIF